MSPSNPHHVPRTKKTIDDIQPRPKRIQRKPICCEGEQPCGLAHCSACTTELLNRLWPQIGVQLVTGTQWLPFTHIWSILLFSDVELAGTTFTRCARALRDKFRAHGLNGLPIIAALDVNREDYLSPDGVLLGYLWSVHLHGFMRVDGRRAEIAAMFKGGFPRNLKVKKPFLFHDPASQRGWAEYQIKDPSWIGKRILDPRLPRPYKRQLAYSEAAPVMNWLATQRARDRVFLQGYQIQGQDKLVPIADFGRWPEAESTTTRPKVGGALTRVRTRIRSRGQEKA